MKQTIAFILAAVLSFGLTARGTNDGAAHTEAEVSAELPDSGGSTDVDMLRSGNLPPNFYCYGTRGPFYEQFLDNMAAVEGAGVRVERLQLDGRSHGFGYREDWFDAYDSFLWTYFPDNK